MDREAVTNMFIPLEEDERTLFRQIKSCSQEHGMIVLDHVGSRLAVKPGTFLGRIVAVSRNREQLKEDIRQGIQMLQESISDLPQSQPQQDETHEPERDA